MLFARTTMFKYKILPLFGKLCQDADHQTRKTIAAGFHEVKLMVFLFLQVFQMKFQVAKLLDDEAFLLTEYFVEFVRSGDVEVIAEAIKRFAPILHDVSESPSSASLSTKLDHFQVLNALAINLGDLLKCLYKSGPSVDTNGNVVGSSDTPKVYINRVHYE